MIVLGMLEPTSGQVTIEGLDNRRNIQDVRKILGFCPQYGKQDNTTERAVCYILYYFRYTLY
jgi:ABC-type multidrug transport system ATPase subunit